MAADGAAWTATLAAPPTVALISGDAAAYDAIAGAPNDCSIAATSAEVPEGSNGASGAVASLLQPAASASTATAASERLADCRTRICAASISGGRSARAENRCKTGISAGVCHSVQSSEDDNGTGVRGGRGNGRAVGESDGTGEVGGAITPCHGE